MVVSVYRNNAANPAAQQSRAIAHGREEAKKATGCASHQIASKIHKSCAERMAGTELRKDGGRLRCANIIVAIAKCERIAGVNQDGSRKGREEICGSYRKDGKACAMKGGQDMHEGKLRSTSASLRSLHCGECLVVRHVM